MKVEIENVENVMDMEIRKSKSGTSCYLYLPANLEGRKVKLCLLELEKE